MKKIINAITPPILLSGAKKIKNILNKFRRNAKKFDEPAWNTIGAGPLKNKKIFFCASGNWQKEIINGNYDKFFFDYLKKINVLEKNIFDIGSHIGYSTLCFAEIVGPKGKIFSFEPNIYNLERLKINVEGNLELKKRIKIFNLALSDHNGEDNFIFSHKIESMASGSFLENAHTFWEKSFYEDKFGFKKTKVKIKSIDALYNDKIINNKPDIIKIDTEGAEYLVLKGGEKTINQYKPILFIEIHSIFNMLEVGKILNNWGYITELLKEEKDGRCFICAQSK